MKTSYASALLHLVRETAAVTWVVDADGFVVDVPEWAALTGQTISEIQGDGWLNAIHHDDIVRVQAAWATAVSHGSHYNTDYRLRCADGVYRWFNARGVPVVDVDGTIQEWIGVILPIAGLNRFGRTASSRADDKMSFVDIAPSALRAARAMLGWSATQLATMANVSLSTVRRLEDAGERDSTRNASLAKIIGTLARQPLTLHASAEGVISGVSQAALEDAPNKPWKMLSPQRQLQ